MIPVSIRVNKYSKSHYLSLSFFSSLSLFFFSFRSDCIELDFKEISYLVYFLLNPSLIYKLIDRYFKSSIPYMQSLLNKEDKIFKDFYASESCRNDSITNDNLL